MKKVEEIKWPIKDEELRHFLGLKIGSLNIKRISKNEELIEGENEDYFLDRSIERPGSPSPYRFWTKRGAIKIARYCRKPEAKEFLNRLGVQKRQKSIIERDYIGIIIKAINGFTEYETEYNVDYDKKYYGYRIDLYLKNLNIAIECDEEGHRDRDEWVEEWRKNKIKETLGCKFIRFNPDDTNFNIGDVINQIFSEIISKK